MMVTYFTSVLTYLLTYLLTCNRVIHFRVRDRQFTFAICRRPSVCRLSFVCLSSVMFVRPTQPVEIFGNVSAPFGTLATH